MGVLSVLSLSVFDLFFTFLVCHSELFGILDHFYKYTNIKGVSLGRDSLSALCSRVSFSVTAYVHLPTSARYIHTWTQN